MNLCTLGYSKRGLLDIVSGYFPIFMHLLNSSFRLPYHTLFTFAISSDYLVIYYVKAL